MIGAGIMLRGAKTVTYRSLITTRRKNIRPLTRSRVCHLPGQSPWLPGAEFYDYPEHNALLTRCSLPGAEYVSYLEQNTLLTRHKIHSLPGAKSQATCAKTDTYRVQWQRAQNARPPTRRKIHHQNHKLPGAARRRIRSKTTACPAWSTAT